MDFTEIRLSGKTRREHDLLGEMEIPAEYYFGVQTMRAVENFHISRVRLNFFPELIRALADVKQGAAMANRDLGLLDPAIADAIIRACEELRAGKLEEQFVVDMVQGGAGTSTNMNANEVIANRALELLGHEKGEYQFCHPNNHVNLSQSTNDAYPTAVRIALVRSIEKLVASLRELIAAFHAKGEEFAHIIKMGRTQLQDAVPMTLGQEFEAYAATLTEEIDRLMKEQNARLEQISGMSSEDAKNILIENMKAEAKSDAAAYINETIEEAKLTATKEAKRIIVTSIQRVATETAIENAVTVFNIESDEVKGRIIGREGRNIRALEAATGIEIIVDDTPEAIILSGFDPVRREIARLKASGENPRLVRELERGYRYPGERTCAGDGLCSTNYPVGINTGEQTYALRALRVPPGSLRPAVSPG